MNRLLTTVAVGLLAVTCWAATEGVPATRVTNATNGMTIITSSTVQGALQQADSYMRTNTVALTNQIGQLSGVASQALALAQSTTNAGSQQAYVYTQSANIWIQTVTTVAPAGFYADTQSIARIHVGQAVSNDTYFFSNTLVQAVDRATRFVSLGTYPRSSGSGVSATVYVTGAGLYHVTPDGFGRCKIIVTGGGGGGDGVVGAGLASSGGAGGTAIGYCTLTAGSSNTVTVGAGGGPGEGAGGTNGATSSFGSLLSATGGNGGLSATAVDAIGGLGYGGALNLYGGSGYSVYFTSPAANSTVLGGASYWGGSFTNAVRCSYGAGGSGRVWSESGSGCSGASGVVVVEYF